ncbi:hypothetical protein BCF33_2203 [Hasllibacter halocynthiae]|uniref:Uncharacterized protein n=1 Tax=Hasllibacter halocynthiae TaxID=595589 RepID=A0A2T0X308_9RHOB|nr:hypothetical protein [Hasllibacter halocynthiae]PRY93336.1 hypothetical protein BCF33_2203 [Hasllibacter halocynthiae]
MLDGPRRRPRRRRWRPLLRQAARALPPLVVLLATLAIWSRQPLAQPFVQRGTAEFQVALDAALAARATPDWTAGEMRAALRSSDLDRLAALERLARSRALPLPAALAAEASAALRPDAADCLLCAARPASCASLRQTLLCNLPVELTPVGDALALGRSGLAYARGGEVDGVEATLAAIGGGATVAALVSGGSSASVKAGATLLRVARRTGRLPPAIMDEVAAAARAGDTARLAALGADARRLVDAVGAEDALVLVSRARTPGDLPRLARLAEMAGKDARPALAALGTARTLRLLNRVAPMAMAALALLSALLWQAGLLLARPALRGLVRLI